MRFEEFNLKGAADDYRGTLRAFVNVALKRNREKKN